MAILAPPSPAPHVGTMLGLPFTTGKSGCSVRSCNMVMQERTNWTSALCEYELFIALHDRVALGNLRFLGDLLDRGYRELLAQRSAQLPDHAPAGAVG
jgi:hypothetical protein